MEKPFDPFSQNIKNIFLCTFFNILSLFIKGNIVGKTNMVDILWNDILEAFREKVSKLLLRFNCYCKA